MFSVPLTGLISSRCSLREPPFTLSLSFPYRASQAWFDSYLSLAGIASLYDSRFHRVLQLSVYVLVPLLGQ